MLHEIDPATHGSRGQSMADAVSACVHCGFCLPKCPTYQITGDEAESPRGRIVLMKEVLEGNIAPDEAAAPLDNCLGCLSCVSNCPSGVQYGELIGGYRAESNSRSSTKTLPSRLQRFLINVTLPYPQRFRLAAQTGRHLKRIDFLFPRSIQQMLDMLPTDSLPKPSPLPEFTPAESRQLGSVLLLPGCAQQILAPDINHSAIRVLALNGFNVFVPKRNSCCGALAWHGGEEKIASEFALKTMSIAEHHEKKNEIDYVVTTAAGCGSALKEYPYLLAGNHSETPEVAAKHFSARVRDISELLSEIDLVQPPPLRSQKRIAYQDACHLRHAQKIVDGPRLLLNKIGNLELVELPDSDICCGSAGTYNVEHPKTASELGSIKARQVIASGASVLASGNIGCLVQIEKHLQTHTDRVAVLHTVQILDRAYRQIPT